MKVKKNAAKEAAKLLSKYFPELEKAQDTKKFKINLNHLAEQMGIEVKDGEFSSDISGLFVKKDGRPVIGVNVNDIEQRKRFTIAHELGHYVLHATETLHYDIGSEEIYFRSENIYNNDEREANRFAAELLMPSHLVDVCITKKTCTIEQLASIFGVSQDAMRYRLINLGYL